MTLVLLRVLLKVPQRVAKAHLKGLEVEEKDSIKEVDLKGVAALVQDRSGAILVTIQVIITEASASGL